MCCKKMSQNIASDGKTLLTRRINNENKITSITKPNKYHVKSNNNNRLL